MAKDLGSVDPENPKGMSYADERALASEVRSQLAEAEKRVAAAQDAREKQRARSQLSYFKKKLVALQVRKGEPIVTQGKPKVQVREGSLVVTVPLTLELPIDVNVKAKVSAEVEEED